jgi:NAD-dependent deacetylase
MISRSATQLIQATVLFLREAKHAIAFTGAGISTPSGIPDFRTPGTGLWSKYDPYEVASLSSFQKNPEAFYSWIRPLMMTSVSSKPNLAHLMLAELEKAGILKAIITQNIDGLHQKAGACHVIELHGSINTASCPFCKTSYQLRYLLEQFEAHHYLPRCNQCDHVIKPDITFFEEILPEEAWENANQEMNQSDLVFIIGSSLEVFPANTLPETAIRKGAKLIINTITTTHLDYQAAIKLPFDILETFNLLSKEF